MNYELEEDVVYSDCRIMLGSGSFSDVYMIYDHVNKVFIAVKKLLKPKDVMNETGMDFDRWERYVTREVECFGKLSHLVPFVPLLNFGQPPRDDEKYGYYLYLDFMCGGSLDEVIRQLRYAKIQREEEDLSEEDLEEYELIGWDLKQELIVAYGTARALQFIHATDRIHRDIKPDNILLTHDLEPKICDFGTGRKVSRSGNNTIAVGTWYYSAPEKGLNADGENISSSASDNNRANYGFASDMYSWAITMYEMTTLKCPFEDYIRENDEKSECICKTQIITNSLRPKFPEDYDHPLKRIIEVCWDKSPDIRYTAEVTCQQIYEIARIVLKGEDFEAFDSYVKKVENPRDLNEYEGFHKNIQAAMKRNIAKAYYNAGQLYRHGIANHKKDKEKAENLIGQYKFLLDIRD